MAIVPKPTRLAPSSISFDHIGARLDPTIGPDLDPAAQAGPRQRAMGLLDPDLDRHSDVAQRMLARRSGPAIVAADRDDVGVRLGNPVSRSVR
jgi:hypothetical protein